MKLRCERLPLILYYLEGRRVMLVQVLAYKLDVSVRTIYRDIAFLRRHGRRIDGSAGHGGGIRLLQ